MSEVYILVTFVFLAVAAVRLFISLCSKLHKKKRRKNPSIVIVPGQSFSTPVDVDVFVIDVAARHENSSSTLQQYDFYWDEPPPPPYEEAIRLSLPFTSNQIIHSGS